MKKLLKLTFVFILISLVVLCGKVYATSLDCNIEIQTPKTEYSKDDEFTANVYISNIQSEKGVIALSATLEYDKNSLTLESMSGKNTWDTPVDSVSYNSSTGKMALTRDSLGKNDEIIFEMTFKVNEDSNSTALISLKNITVANGIDTPKDISSVDKTITIKTTSSSSSSNTTDDNNTTSPDSSTDNNNNNTDNSNNDTNTNQTPSTNTTNNSNSSSQNTNTNTNTNTNSANTNTNSNNTNTNTNTNTNQTYTDNTIKTTGSIPATGIASHPVLIILLIIAIAIGIYFYVRIKFINNKAK